MNKNLHTDEEPLLLDSQECSDSDKYTLDNIDLLNLPVNFRKNQSEGNSRYQRNQKNQLGASGDYPYLLKATSSKTSESPSKSTIFTQSETESYVHVYSDREQQERSRKIAYYDQFLGRRSKEKLKKEFLVDPRRNRKPGNNLPAAFPFRKTPSGNLKISSGQVAFQTGNLSVLIADPNKTVVDIEPIDEMPLDRDYGSRKDSVIESVISPSLGYGLGSLLVGKLADVPLKDPSKEATEYEGRNTDEILEPELNLSRLGYTTGDSIDWGDIRLPEKKNLYLELYARITNFTNADCKIYIDNEEFNCHLIVLQCYSDIFHNYVAVKKVELPSDKCSAQSFAFIYEWMITGDPSYKDLNRENVLDIFNAAKYLKIRDLIEQCWAFIDNQEIFNEDSAFLLYVDAKQKNLPEVRELMLPRIQRFFLMLVSSQDWLELELEDVQCFLQSNYICVNCEMEIFMSAVRWLKHDWKNRDALKVALLACVRFGNIAPWQLVDIKRNPENAEFLELSKNSEICKMIDDGLAYVIIKYWYGQENDDYQHWNAILALKEPHGRNWSGMEKTYFTFREFLIYLDQYRRAQMIEKSKPVRRQKKRGAPFSRYLGQEGKDTPPRQSTEELLKQHLQEQQQQERDQQQQPQTTTGPRLPTMDEFLASRRPVGRERYRDDEDDDDGLDGGGGDES